VIEFQAELTGQIIQFPAKKKKGGTQVCVHTPAKLGEYPVTQTQLVLVGFGMEFIGQDAQLPATKIPFGQFGAHIPKLFTVYPAIQIQLFIMELHCILIGQLTH
jgi:hypothetical protein